MRYTSRWGVESRNSAPSETPISLSRYPDYVTYLEGLLRDAQRAILCYMIKSFRHKGLRHFYETGNAAGVQASHRKRLRFQLSALDTAVKIEDMDIPGF